MSGFTEKAAETIPELNATLATYRGQLTQVKGLLEASPGSEEILKIKSQVDEAITLTEKKLVEARLSESSNREKCYTIGAYVVVRCQDNKWMTCSISELPTSEENKIWIVTPVGQTTTLTATVDNMRPWRPPSHVKKGDYIEAVLPTMGSFHPAKIDTVTSTNTAWVLFKNSSNIEEVPLAHIRYPKKGNMKKARNVDDSGIQPPAVEKRQKKKEEWKSRIEGMNIVQEGGRDDWKSFMGSKKMSRKIGVRSGVNKGQSIFSSEQGDKIGITKKK